MPGTSAVAGCSHVTQILYVSEDKVERRGQACEEYDYQCAHVCIK